MDEVFEELRKAITDKRPLTILYYGGSTPGTRRIVTPIAVSPMELRARCHRSGKTKNFLVAKIRIFVGDTLLGPEHSPDPPATTSLVDALSVRIPGQAEHRFRRKVSTDSGGS